MNRLDKIINYFSPNMGAKRTYARSQIEFIENSGYGSHGGSKSKENFEGWRHETGGPDEDIVANIQYLRERSRDLFMGAPLATGALKKFRANIVGMGLVPKPNLDYEFLGITQEKAVEIEKTIKREFNNWASSTNADSMRMHTFYTLQGLVVLSWVMNGDVFIIPTLKKRKGVRSRLSIQLVEADRVMNPYSTNGKNIREGVELDHNGEVVAYHIANKHPGDDFTITTKRIRSHGDNGRRNVLHVFEPERVGQRRGVPVLAPVLEHMKQLQRYSIAELNAAVISGYFSVFLKTEHRDEIGPKFNDLDEYGRTPTEQLKVNNSTSFQVLSPEESVESVNPTRPNANYKNFVDSIIEEIGTALEIPKSILMSQFDTSYSASRAALEEAWKKFIAGREIMKTYFNQPIYEEFIIEMVADGRIDLPGFFDDELKRKAYCNAIWVGPKKANLNPYQEAKAAEIRIQQNLSTREIEAQELGHDFDEVVKQRGREEKAIRENGIKGEE